MRRSLTVTAACTLGQTAHGIGKVSTTDLTEINPLLKLD